MFAHPVLTIALGVDNPGQGALGGTDEVRGAHVRGELDGLLSVGSGFLELVCIHACAVHREPDRLFVHASPSKPTVQYVWPGFYTHFFQLNAQLDTYLAGILEQFGAVHGFCGHTRCPAVLLGYADREILPIFQDYNRKYSFIGPTTAFYVPQGPLEIEDLSGRPLVINPGSVGQPRDGDPRASWALYDGETVSFRRVEYDPAPTQKKLRALEAITPGQRERQASRLSRGR